jgi:hypothetical protein
MECEIETREQTASNSGVRTGRAGHGGRARRWHVGRVRGRV